MEMIEGILALTAYALFALAGMGTLYYFGPKLTPDADEEVAPPA